MISRARLLLSCCSLAWLRGCTAEWSIAEEGPVPGDGTMQLELSAGGHCLDGSPPGFYHRLTGSSKWVVFFQGGGWCYNEEDCYKRSSTFLGSSTVWPKNVSKGGVLSANAKTNPDFHGWNMVHFNYCDGASFAGHRPGTVVVNGKHLYMRGHEVMNALFQTLASKHSFDKASDVLLTGCSAGGLSTYMHADYVRSTWAPKSANFKAMPECGYFLDYPNVDGRKVYLEEMRSVFRMQHIGSNPGDTSKKCVQEMAPHGEEWKCIFSPYVLPHVTTPHFLINSAYDQWQMANVVGAGNSSFFKCAVGFPNASDCSERQIAQANRFHDTMLSELKSTPSFHDEAQNGAFIHSCWSHCWAQSSKWWSRITVGGRSMAQAVGDWFFGRSARNVHIDCKYAARPPYACNPSCEQGRG
jgi:O-palmitoleoyl-L-serine hydrolase